MKSKNITKTFVYICKNFLSINFQLLNFYMSSLKNSCQRYLSLLLISFCHLQLLLLLHEDTCLILTLIFNKLLLFIFLIYFLLIFLLYIYFLFITQRFIKCFLDKPFVYSMNNFSFFILQAVYTMSDFLIYYKRPYEVGIKFMR